MIRITVEFQTVAEAAHFLSKVDAPSAPPVPVEKPAKPKVTPKVVTPPAPPAPEPTPPVAPVQIVTPPAPTAPGALTLDAVRAALRNVFNKPGGTGAQAATTLLKKYNATSVSQVKPEDYAAFIKDCA